MSNIPSGAEPDNPDMGDCGMSEEAEKQYEEWRSKMIIIRGHRAGRTLTDKLMKEAFLAGLASRPKVEEVGEKISDGRFVYAYTDIKEYESIIGYPVNEAFIMGWNMARITKAQLGISTPPTGKDGE